ncbi:hypothetical protein GIB67_017134 [Kingdonia uniflora]|uniref:Uncharacterized protein n=1 Tax=Kingdonia uniflora TaxID=39325 RepID=A0A7J7NZH4_9MAGN|nr:hypothetical protein GIB67_017134 [Kingdonia uniflora]
MNGVQLYTIVHFSGDIVHPKISSIVTYVGGRTKLTSLRAHSSYEDFDTLHEETSKICCEDCKLYNFQLRPGCACAISLSQDFTVMINMHKTNRGTSFHIWIVNDLRVPSQNFISDFCYSGKGLSTTKDMVEGYPERKGRGLDPCRFGPFVDDENDYFKTIRTDVPPSNEPSIPQSNVHLSNEPVLTNVPQSNETFETIPTNVPFSNEPLFLNQLYDLICHRYTLIWYLASMIYSEMSYTYRKEAEKSQARLTPWATDYWRAKNGTCHFRWWQTIGIPYEHRVHTLGLANVKPTTRAFEYYSNNTYKAVYEPIWIPIRGIKQWKILKTDPRVRAPILTVERSSSHAKEEKGKNAGLVTKLRLCSRCRKTGHNRRS